MATETHSTSTTASSARPTPRVRVPLPPPDVVDEALTCAACGAANASDSRFCRKCGDAFVATAPTASSAVASSATAPLAASANGANSKADGGVDVKRVATLSDETRARHLLDRAFALAERGDRAGAILACRQSVALAPDVPQGFSMLGLLLERNGDLKGAANAYTRVLHLAPGSRLEEESLARLRATMDTSSSRRKNVPTFDFNDDDLNGATSNDAATSSIPVAAVAAAALTTAALTTAALTTAALTTAVAATPDVAQTPALDLVDKHGTRVLPPAASVAAAPLSASASIAAPLSAPTVFAPDAPQLPVRTTTVQTAPVAVPLATVIPAVSVLDFDLTDEPRAPLWRQIASRPTFYWSGLPLAGAALLGLLVMSWGRSNALTNQVVAPDATTSTTNGVTKNSGAPAANNGANNAGVPDYSVNTPPGAVGGAGPNDSYSFGSAPRPVPGASNNPAANGAAPNEQASANNRDANVNNNSGGNNGVARVPNRAPSRVQPAFPSPQTQPIAPAMPSNLPQVRPMPGAQPDSGSILLTPSTGQSNGSNVASSGGAPFGANRPKNSGSITLSPRRSPDAAAPRPSNSARNSERAAANASSSGRGNDAIDSINSALQSGGDTGWRYQQRALLFLERGDNQRAADDFQSAISAYRDQINRGERASEAKAGIQACQSGLRLALANAR